jgi:hypothetical protein
LRTAACLSFILPSAYDPNLAGSAHVFRDDLQRVRFFRNNADLDNMTSQGFRYIKYDAWGRIAEVGVLLNVAKSSFADYAQWARQADLDQQLTGANSCPVFTFSYDLNPVTGSRLVSLRHPMEAQDEEDEEKKIELEQPTTQNQGTDEDVNDAPLNSAAADGNDGSPPDQQEFEEKEELDQKQEPAQASEPSERHMPRSEDVEENRSGKCCCCIL